MSSMREKIAGHIENFQRRHHNAKKHRFGFLVRPLVLTLGWLVFAIGLITVPLPGPGWLTVFVGVAILSLELRWASRVLAWGVRQYDRFFTWYRVQPRKTRYSLIGATWVMVWIAMGGIAFGMWKAGVAPVLDPVMAQVMQAVP